MSLILPKKRALIAGGVSLVAAPTIADSDLTAFGGGIADPQVFSTTNLSWSAGQRIFTIFGTHFGTVDSVTGSTDDTWTGSAHIESNVDVNAHLFLDELTVVSSALDANINFAMTNARRCTAWALQMSGVVGYTAVAENTGSSSGAPVAAARTVSGTKNRLVIAAAVSRGAHVTNPPAAPSGMTLLGTAATASNNPTGTSESTTAVAYQVLNENSTTIPAATFTGWDDIGTQVWCTFHWAFESE